MNNERRVVNRKDFIDRFRSDCGFDYLTACAAFNAMVSTVEDAVVNGEQVRIGRVGVLLPVRTNPRTVHMGFKRVKGGIERTQRVYCIGGRLRWRFNIYKSFMAKHELNWFV